MSITNKVGTINQGKKEQYLSVSQPTAVPTLLFMRSEDQHNSFLASLDVHVLLKIIFIDFFFLGGGGVDTNKRNYQL